MNLHKPDSELWGELDWRGRRLRVNFAAGTTIAIPLIAGGPQPAFFAPVPFSASPLQLGDFTGSVQHGGSCNVQVLNWAPHCHGTHTECVGHIVGRPADVATEIDNTPCLARLVSVEADSDNRLITLEKLRQALATDLQDYAALVIRTQPNSTSKKARNYDLEPGYALLDSDCMAWLSASILQHLLVDMPSLDAADDSNLPNHHTWWGVRDGKPAFGSRSIHLEKGELLKEEVEPVSR